jgi:hypothetical protein
MASHSGRYTIDDEVPACRNLTDATQATKEQLKIPSRRDMKGAKRNGADVTGSWIPGLRCKPGYDSVNSFMVRNCIDRSAKKDAQ